MAFIYEKDSRNIVTLTMDMPGRSANVINLEFGEAFKSVLERLVADSDVVGVIVASAKKTFLAGAEIEVLFEVTDPEVVFKSVEALKAGFRALETLGKPVVAAINGSALGGGCELALACHHRIAVNSRETQIGVPEVTLGLLPGAGGITRLSRMLGLQEAFPYLMEGKKISPEEALKAGIIHELAADPAEMLEKARSWILANPEAAQPWDKAGFKMPGGDPRTPKMAQMLSIAPAMLRQKTYGNYPAPIAIMSAAVEGALVDFDTASRIESRYLAEVATGKVAKNMINAFWTQLNAINAGSSRPAGFDRFLVAKVGILGAGMMGSGIAYSTAMSGIQVVLKDVSKEIAEKDKGYTEKLLGKRVSQGRMKKEKMGDILGRILATDNPDDLKGCDLIIEAVFEDREIKAQVTQEAESRMAETAVFASNTSTLPITGLAKSSSRPANFVGLHFFSPVDKMPLVEIIRGKETAEETLAKAFDYVRQIKKTPIVVNDSRGFYTSRVFGTYVNEGLAMLAEGQHPRAIESASLQAGMPVGPLAVSDEVSLSLMIHIRKQTEKDLAAEGKEAPHHPGHRVVDTMVKEYGRAGKAAGKGFYEYPKEGKKFLWPELKNLFPDTGEKLSQPEMIERLMFIQALETVRCYEENVVTNTADANLGSIFGWGFAPFKGGTLQYINDYGVAEFVTRSQELAAKYGERFSPPPLLLGIVERGERF